MNFLKKNRIYVVLLAVLAIIFLLPGLKEKIRNQLFPEAIIREAVRLPEADYDITLKGINVPDSNLKNFYGKTVFLNFWGTWCPPCREEWPTIQQLYDAKKGKAAFVLIAMQDREESVRKFLADNHYTVPVYIAESPISEKILPKSFPTTFILKDDGQFMERKDTSFDWNTPEIHMLLDKAAQ